MTRVWWLAMLLLPAVAHAEVARFAVVAGNNRGSDRRAVLQYATQDARRFADLLETLGGFPREHVRLLEDASPAVWRQALAAVDQELRAVTASETLLVVYFSGHADGVNLEMGGAVLPFEEVRRLLKASPARLKVAFVDSCHSGQLTVSKGGRPGPAFDLLVKDSLDVDGTAIVTSSSPGETSQESTTVQGSFFTHHLLSGLRGAADRNQDQRVTLTEAYNYAYAKTVVETATTIAGAQHPSYDYKLSGRGDVVLTELERGDSHLGFGPEAAGVFLVLAGEQQVVAEVNKSAGTKERLALPAGEYLVVQRRPDGAFAQRLTLARGRVTQVDLGAMQRRSLSSTLKGGGHSPDVTLTAAYGLMSGVLQSSGAVHEGSLGVRVDLGPLALFPHLAYGHAAISDPARNLDYEMQLFTAEGYVTWRFAYSFLDLLAGVSLGTTYGIQRTTNGETYSGMMFGVGAVAGLDLPLSYGFTLQAFWEVGAGLARVQGALARRLVLEGVVGLGYEL